MSNLWYIRNTPAKTIGLIAIVILIASLAYLRIDRTNTEVGQPIVNPTSPLADQSNLTPSPVFIPSSNQSPLATNVPEPLSNYKLQNIHPNDEILALGNQSISTSPFNELIEIVPRTILFFESPIDDLIAFQIKDSFVYLATTEGPDDNPKSRLDIINITSPIEPQLSSSLFIDDLSIQCMDVSTDYLVVVAGSPQSSSRESNIAFIYDIADKSNPTLLIKHDMPENDCKSLSILQDYVYITTSYEMITFDLPRIEAVQLLPRGSVEHIVTRSNREPTMILVRGVARGKWGYMTYVQSVNQSKLPMIEIIADKEWGGIWYTDVTTWGDLLFLRGYGYGLTIQKISDTGRFTGVCSIYSEQSTLDPFHSAIHFIGPYGFYLTDGNRVASINLSNIYFPQQGPDAFHSTQPLGVRTEGKFVYVAGEDSLTTYETIWSETEETARRVEHLSESISLVHESYTKHRCVEDEVQLATKKEHEALLAIYHSLGGDSWYYQGVTSPSSNDREYYAQLGPWPLGSNPCSWSGVICSCNGHVIELHLAIRNLRGDVPPEIGDLQHLEILDLGYNGLISSLPPEIGNLKNLQYLDLLWSTSPNAEVQALPEVCIRVDDKTTTGPGCQARQELRSKPKPGCTYRPKY